MSDDFKKKLEDYANGSLSEEEKKEVEHEMDKMEIYQAYVDEMMGGKEADKETNINEKKLVKRGKWKARFFNTFLTIAVLIVFLIISSILTAVYYSQGEPGRSDVYREVMEVAVATFIPNVTMRNSGMNGGPFFTARYDGNLIRRVGSEDVDLGEINANFFFSLPSIELPRDIHSSPMIFYPEDKESSQTDGFEQLRNLPEGTVSELYISFSDYMTTDEVLKLFKDRNMLLRWFAVDIGGWKNKDNIDFTLIGFPYDGYFLQMNDELISREEEKTGTFSSVVSESWQQDGFEAFGDGEKRNKEFLQALQLLKEHTGITEQFLWSPSDRLEESISYIEENGVRIYGAVVTGPSKELLKLESEDWVRSAAIGETRLWNWEEIE